MRTHLQLSREPGDWMKALAGMTQQADVKNPHLDTGFAGQAMTRNSL